MSFVADDALRAEISQKLAPLASSHETNWILEYLQRTQDENTYRQALDHLLARRLANEPLAYIFGEWAFRRFDFAVGPGVLIPRPESEELVEYALSFTEQSVSLMETLFDDGAFNVVDAGAGSGCIGLSYIADLLKDVSEEGFDATAISQKIKLVLIENSALARPYLEKNIAQLRTHLRETQIEIFPQSWVEWPSQPLQVLLGNPPYLSQAEYRACDSGVKDREPQSALTPLDLAQFPDASGPYRELIQLAEKALVPGGFAIFETGPSQDTWLKSQTKKLENFDRVRFYRDMAGKDRFFTMRKKENG